MKSLNLDQELNITTSDISPIFYQDTHLHRYEPTLYEHLTILLEHYTLLPTDHLIDYGCGKGRLNFYFHHFCQCQTTGIEMDESLFEDALENLNTYQQKHRLSPLAITFENTYAQTYCILPSQNKFYFFNPFSVQLFIKVINQILLSYETSPRPLDLILYYPLADYLNYLDTCTLFEPVLHLNLPNAHKDSRECFIIYRLT